MKKKPLVSIIMGIYNCENYIRDSIDSILSQSFDDWELIMCDDGSTDKTFQIAEEYRIKYPHKLLLLKNQQNKGLNYTLNKCIDHSNGIYIARQDGDDISLPNRLELEVKYLDFNKDIALVGSNMILFDENGKWGRTNTASDPTKFNFIKSTPFCHATCMIRKDVLDEVNGYSVDEKLLRVEDYHLWFKIYQKGYKGHNLEECLYMMRDDRDAIRRRSFKNRINEARVKAIGFKMLKLPYSSYLYVFKPLLLAITPIFVYKKIHNIKYSKA